MKPISKIKRGRPLKKAILEKLDEIVDYLRAVRPVPGRGVRISESANGLCFSVDPSRRAFQEEEEAAHAVIGGYAGPFAVELVEGSNAVRIYNGAQPSDEYAGVIQIGNLFHNMPVGTLQIIPETAQEIYLTVYYNVSGNPPGLVYEFATTLSSTVTGAQGWYRRLATVSATGTLTQLHWGGDIEISGRWI